METQTASPPDGGIQAGSPAFDALMQAISTYQSTLTVKIDHVQAEMALIRRDMDRFREPVMEVERRVSGTEDMQREHHADLQLLKSKFSPHFSIERAHRMPAARSPQGAPLRTFIFKLLHYRDRDTVLGQLVCKVSLNLKIPGY